MVYADVLYKIQSFALLQGAAGYEPGERYSDAGITKVPTLTNHQANNNVERRQQYLFYRLSHRKVDRPQPPQLGTADGADTR
jgi:hypothetical protein